MVVLLTGNAGSFRRRPRSRIYTVNQPYTGIAHARDCGTATAAVVVFRLVCPRIFSKSILRCCARTDPIGDADVASI